MSTNSSRYINSGILIHHPFIHSGIPHVNEEELPRVITWMCLIDIISSEGSQTSEIRHCMNPSVLWSRSKGGCLLGLSIDWIGEGNVTPLHNFCLENPMDGGAWWAAVHGVTRVGHDWATSLSLFTFMHWRRKWQPTPVFLPGESQGRESLVGCRLWGRTGLDTTEVT